MRKLTAMLILLALLSGCGAASGPEIVQYWNMRAEALPEGMDFVNDLCVTKDGRTVLGGDGLYLGSGEGYAACALPEGCAQILALSPAPEGGFAALAQTGAGEGVCLLSFEGLGALRGSREVETQRYTRLLLTEDGRALALSEGCLYDLDGGAAEAEKGAQFTAMAVYEGRVLVCAYVSAGERSEICELDAGTMELRRVMSLPGRYVWLLGLSPEGGLLAGDPSYIDGGLRLLEPEAGDTERYLLWQETGVSGRAFSTLAAAEGRLLLCERGGTELWVCEYLSGPARTVITMAVDEAIRTDALLLASAFNRQSEQYRVDVEYFSPSASTSLLTELGAGEGPDMFGLYYMETLAEAENNGVFLDLLPTLEEEDRLGLIEPLYDALSETGVLYRVPYGFNIGAFRGPESLLGEGPVTLVELQAAAEELGGGATVFPQGYTADVVLSWGLRFTLESYVDRESGSCSFDSEGFVQLLEACAAAPKTSEQGGSGPNLLTLEVLSQPQRLATIRKYSGNDYSFVGFPCAGGNGSAFMLDLHFAVSARSGEVEGCLEFIRWALSEEGQAPELMGTMGPVSRRALSPVRSILEAEVEDLLENGVQSKYEPGLIFEEAEAEKFWRLLEGTCELYGTDPALYEIIDEEAAVFFAGDRSAEEAARLIQDRASTYLSELYG